MSMSEQNIQRLIMLALSDAGVTIFRNNIGAYTTPDGHRIKYGLGNPGGSDLIGITPVTITENMVGQTVGVFTAVEVKTATGRVTPAQENFIRIIRESGGMAGVCRSVDDALGLKNTF